MQQELDSLTIPLTGTHLIEASAGTGKTYTITDLYARLLLEKKLTVEQILVVTFTEAATEELRERIRKRLSDLYLTLKNPPKKTDNQLTILKNIDLSTDNYYSTLSHLENALREFDQAAIFTIHGFCHRVLRENAFESGMLFEMELIKEQTELLQEIIQDFWRKYLYQADKYFIEKSLEKLKNPTELMKQLTRFITQPTIPLIPDKLTPTQNINPLIQRYQDTFQQLKKIWIKQQDEIKTLLNQATQPKKNILSAQNGKYPREKISIYFSELESFFEQDNNLKLHENFKKFCQSHLKDCTNKSAITPTHPFFAQCDSLLELYKEIENAYNNQFLTLKSTLITQSRQQLQERKQQFNRQSFDDLLTHLYFALNNANGENLANCLVNRYQAALIDEFQDTDKIQYDIFCKIYQNQNKPLFMIGDPKQAIYSFRGADIYTYLKAAQGAGEKHTYTLLTNWRSEPDLIHAINTLFQQNPNPFIQNIAFHPVKPPENSEKPYLTLRGKNEPPLHIWFLTRKYFFNPEKEKPEKETKSPPLIKKSTAKPIILAAIAHEIVQLLTLAQKGQAKLGDKPLEAGDIAILVRSNAQARDIQKILLNHHIPNVLYSADDLFDTHETQEIERILLAIANPSQEGLLRSALTTDILGLTGNEIYQLLENDAEWQKYLKYFHYYHWVWQKKGFIQMFRLLLTQKNIPQRLLQYPDGERRLTNVLHLAEILQKAALNDKLGMNALCLWLAERRADIKGHDEHQLRLESDEKRVKIITIHKSKGLEYPIVFCPFLWDGNSHLSAKESFIFHQDNGERFIDIGSDKSAQHLEKAKAEEKAENLRLLYVALTRAKNRCYIIWGAINDAFDSALAHLLNAQKSDLDEKLWETLQNLAKNADNKILVNELSMNFPKQQLKNIVSTQTQLHARLFPQKVQQSWKMMSFTMLNSKIETENPDYDEFSSQEERPFSTQTEKNIFTFPRGARAGIFLHALLEQLDFNQADNHSRLISEQLNKHGYVAAEWENIVADWIVKILHTPLNFSSSLCLQQIVRHKRLNELEFYYPLTANLPKQLGMIFMQQGYFKVADMLASLSYEQLQGFMKGYIDLIFEHDGRFYIVDYKSNYLGDAVAAYHRDKLGSVMLQEGYLLQSYIYALALHLYLSVRLPNYVYSEHFGGVYYLFLRGMSPEYGAEFGIYHEVPPQQVVAALAAAVNMRNS